MKIYKQNVINLTQQYLTELINHNEEVNIRMFYSTFEEDQYISILNDQDQEVSFNFVNEKFINNIGNYLLFKMFYVII